MASLEIDFEKVVSSSGLGIRFHLHSDAISGMLFSLYRTRNIPGNQSCWWMKPKYLSRAAKVVTAWCRFAAKSMSSWWSVRCSGGRGGDVLLRADSNLNTLYFFHRQVHFKAKPGGRGGSSNKTGADADALVVSVPCGTVVRDADTGGADCRSCCRRMPRSLLRVVVAVAKAIRASNPPPIKPRAWRKKASPASSAG